jgi:MarR family 2-MHQ and catechol resistance regulon transcriptional repressor
MAGIVELTGGMKDWSRLQMATAALNRARDLELAKIGLNMPQAEILYCVKTAKEPMTPMKLSRMMHKQPHTVSAMVHRMESRGLVVTRRDMKRKNWVRVSLTKKGEEAFDRWSVTTMVPDVAFSSLSREEREMLSFIAKRLHAKSVELLRQMQPDPYSEPLFW